MGNKSEKLEFEIVNGRDYIWKTPTKIETIEVQLSACPHCLAALSSGFALVPLGRNEKAKVVGVECRKCHTLFVARSKSLRKLLQDNEHAKEMTLNGESLWNYSYIRKKEAQQKKWLKKLHEKLMILSQVNGSIMLVTLKSNDEQVDCVITNNKEPQMNQEYHIIHYSSLLAREIITSIYHFPRNIKFGGKEYKVVRPYYPSACVGRKQIFPIELMPSEMRIKPKGGYSTSIKNNYDEVVDVLLYSPRTQLFEIARATYNTLDGECYMDIGIFRSFVKEYGNPGLKLSFDESTTYGLSFDELRAESILHAYGYSVSESVGLTEAERRELLAEIVDLELLTTPYVVHLLDFFIRTHTSDKYYYARDKWTRDIKYISNYNVNPERFLIVR